MLAVRKPWVQGCSRWVWFQARPVAKQLDRRSILRNGLWNHRVSTDSGRYVGPETDAANDAAPVWTLSKSLAAVA